MKKRILSLLLALLMLAGILPFQIFAEGEISQPVCDQNCNATSVSAHAETCAVKAYYKNLYTNSSAQELYKIWKSLSADAQSYILDTVSWNVDQTKRAELVQLLEGGTQTDPSTPTDPTEPEPVQKTLTETYNGKTVTVSGKLPEGTKLKVTAAEGTEALEKFGISADRMVFGLDITLMLNDEEYQPKSAVTVKVPTNATPGTEIGILHTHKGETSYIGRKTVLADGYVEFSLDGFSSVYGFNVIYKYVDTTNNSYSHFFTCDVTEKLSNIIKRINNNVNPSPNLPTTGVQTVELTFSDPEDKGKLMATETESGDDWNLKCSEELEDDCTCKFTYDNAGTVTEVTLVLTTAKQYTLTLNAAGGKLNNGKATYDLAMSYDRAFYSEVGWLWPTRDGYKFKGWYTDKNGQGTKVYYMKQEAEGTSPPVHEYYYEKDSAFWESNGDWIHQEDVTLYAHWEPITYYATLIQNDTEKANIEFTIETPIDLTSYKNVNGQIIWWTVTQSEGNWNEMESGSDHGNTVYEEGRIPAGRWGNVTLTAENLITFNYTDGWMGEDQQTKEQKYYVLIGTGRDCDVYWLSPTRTGYTFTGWYDDQTGGKQVYDQEGKCTTEGGYWNSSKQWTGTNDLIVYAQWKINEYTITFDTDGGTAVAPITQNYNTAVTAPAAPTKEGYTFAGWDKEIPANMPAENVTIKAKWTINQYTITFDTAGGTAIAPIKQDYGTAVTAPAAPTKVGYTFAGWDKEIPATMPAENVTITAKWTINQYTITFDTAGGNEIAPMTQDYGTAVTAPDAPTKDGYTFAGWDPEIPATMPAEDMTLTAQWEINTVALVIKAPSGQSFLFDVKGKTLDNRNVNLTVEVSGTKTVKLPAGNYTVANQNGWSWRYANVESQEVHLRSADVTADFSGSFSQNKSKWLSGYSS